MKLTTSAPIIHYKDIYATDTMRVVEDSKHEFIVYRTKDLPRNHEQGYRYGIQYFTMKLAEKGWAECLTTNKVVKLKN